MILNIDCVILNIDRVTCHEIMSSLGVCTVSRSGTLSSGNLSDARLRNLERKIEKLLHYYYYYYRVFINEFRLII